MCPRHHAELAKMIEGNRELAVVDLSLSADFAALRTDSNTDPSTIVETITLSNGTQQPPPYEDGPTAQPTLMALRKNANEPLQRFRSTRQTLYKEHKSSLPPVNTYNRCHGCCPCDDVCCAEDFHNGLCSCFTCTVCWMLPCLLPCFLSELNASLQDRPALCCETICCPSLYTMRATLRHRRNYPQRPCSDCLAVSMYAPLAFSSVQSQAALSVNGVLIFLCNPGAIPAQPTKRLRKLGSATLAAIEKHVR